MIKHGQTYSARKFRNAYDKHCVPVLVRLGTLERTETPRGKPRKWTVVGTLPTQEAYLEARRGYYAETLTALIDNAYSDAEAVGEELTEWYDGMPENLQEGEKGDTLQESASTIENAVCEKPDLPEGIDGYALTVEFFPGKCDSRPARLAEARARLEAAADLLEEWCTDRTDANTEDDLTIEVMDVIETLREGARELEDVECPGMFG